MSGWQLGLLLVSYCHFSHFIIDCVLSGFDKALVDSLAFPVCRKLKVFCTRTTLYYNLPQNQNQNNAKEVIQSLPKSPVRQYPCQTIRPSQAHLLPSSNYCSYTAPPIKTNFARPMIRSHHENQPSRKNSNSYDQ